MIGQQIGQYETVEVIGQGGMATVYKAYHPATDRYVAIKVMTRQLSEDPKFLARFQREARVVARLEHRSIVPIYDYGEHEGMPYIVMRLIEHGTLRTLIFRDEIDLPTAARIIEQVAEALDYAHSQGVIHRDLKPSNILLDERNNAYLTDFGIAKMLGSTTQVTASGVVGTPSYMSPEQCQGKTVTASSDIYALGAILYEVIAGKPPYVADTPLTVMYMHVKDPIPSARAVNPALPPAVDQVVGRALEKQPELRYQTAAALAADFRQAISTAAPPAVVTPPEPVEEFVEQVGAVQAEDTEATIEVVDVEVVDDGFPPDELTPESALDETYPERGRVTSGFTTVLAVVLGTALLLGAVGLGLLAISWIDSSGGSAVAPTLPPRDTLTPSVAGGATATPVIGKTATQPFTATVGIIIEPTEETPEASHTPPPPTSPPPTATKAPTSVPPTATTAPPTSTPTVTLTPSITPTSTATMTSTTPPTGGSGLLAYTRGSGDNAEIAVIDANGQNPRVLTDNGFYDGEPDWSPNGARIAFESTRDGNRDIFVMSSSGGDVQQLTTSAEPDRHPDWSPDGSKIAYESGNEDTSEIYVVGADGSGATRLTDNSYGDRAPQFSPDGTQIAFMTKQRGKWEIAIMSYPDGEVTRIFDCPAPDCRFPTWSPDGTQIAYNTLDAAGNIADVWLLDVSSGASTALIEGRDNGRPVWSGDGVFIFLNRTVEGNTDLYRIKVASGLVERLTTDPSTDYGPDWGPG